MLLKRREKTRFRKLIFVFLGASVVALAAILAREFFLPEESGQPVFLEPLVGETFFEKLEKMLGEFDIGISGKIVEEREIILATASTGTTFVFPKKSDYGFELASLQIILKNIRIEGKWPKKIDLRFSRPIIEF